MHQQPALAIDLDVVDSAVTRDFRERLDVLDAEDSFVGQDLALGGGPGRVQGAEMRVLFWLFALNVPAEVATVNSAV